MLRFDDVDMRLKTARASEILWNSLGHEKTPGVGMQLPGLVWCARLPSLFLAHPHLRAAQHRHADVAAHAQFLAACRSGAFCCGRPCRCPGRGSRRRCIRRRPFFRPVMITRPMTGWFLRASSHFSHFGFWSSAGARNSCSILPCSDAVAFGDADQRFRLAADVVDVFPQADRGGVVGKGRRDGQRGGDDEGEVFHVVSPG